MAANVANRKSIKGRTKADLALSKVRSAVTNGSSVLADVDHRSAWMRRLRDLISAQISDLGGEEALSEGEKMIVRRASMICLQLEMMDQQFAQNEGVATPRQIETYQRASGALRRLLESLGLQRRARDVTPPTLREYLHQREAAE